MNTTFILIGLIITIIGYLIIRLIVTGFVRPKKFPPGPQWFPIVGNTLQLKGLIYKLGGQHHAFTHLAKLYNTNVLGLKLGRELFIVVFTESLIKQIFTNESFQARPDSYFIRLRSMGTRKGITMTDGPFWEEQKTFVVHHLRELGFGKSLMEDLIWDELKEMINGLKNVKEISWTPILTCSSINVLWALAAGKRFAPNDPRLQELITLMEMRTQAFDMSGGILSQLPWLRHIAPEYTGFTLINNLNFRLSQMILDLIQEHKKTLDIDITRDFIDAFLHQMNIEDGKTSTFTDVIIRSTACFNIRANFIPELSELFNFCYEEVMEELLTLDKYLSSNLRIESTFFKILPTCISLLKQEGQLVMVCLDFFISGSQTTSNTLNFALLNAVLYPDMQQRIQEEIDLMLPDGQLPSAANRNSFPYTEAFLTESQRYHFVAPISGPRRTVKETTMDGYIIPKGTTVLYHMHHLYNDSEIWTDPNVFRPERFLDEDGNFCPKLLYAFGQGKRRCLGETLAKNFIFIFFVGLLKQFNMTPVTSEGTPSDDPIPGVTLSAKPYNVYLSARNS